MITFFSAEWSGAKLTDVLELVGIQKLTSTTELGGKHVEFISVDKCKVMAMACKCTPEMLDSFFLFIASWTVFCCFHKS